MRANVGAALLAVALILMVGGLFSAAGGAPLIWPALAWAGAIVAVAAGLIVGEVKW